MFQKLRMVEEFEYIVFEIPKDIEKKKIENFIDKKINKLKLIFSQEKNKDKKIKFKGKDFSLEEIEHYTLKIKEELENEEIEILFGQEEHMLGLFAISETFERDVEETKTKFVKGSVRSGNKVEYNGSIVVMGDVNKGAEVIAESNVVVLGTLRGLAHAGASGNESAIVTANATDKAQIRIADFIEQVDTYSKCPIFYLEDYSIRVQY